MNSDPTEQHDLPKTYLKRFSINPKNRANKSMVYCYWKDERESQLKPVSIDSKHFKSTDFYTIEHPEEPYVFEHFFRREIEPRYNQIIAEIEKEEDISFECRQSLVLWLYYNKLRNRAFRSNTERISSFLMEMALKTKYGVKAFSLYEDEVRHQSKVTAATNQLEAFLNDDLRIKFDKGIGVKYWTVLKSTEIPFITNDNPGFSMNINLELADLSTLTSHYAINHRASNFFPLSPKYLLQITPYEVGDSLDSSLINQKIQFIKSSNDFTHFINSCTAATRTKYLISNDKATLEQYQH